MAITSLSSKRHRARITSQGQITVPKSVRDAMGVRPGDELEFEPAGEAYLVRPRTRRSILELSGIAGKASGRIPPTAEALDRLIADGMAADAARRQR
jgi:antitoxin PrlF